MCPVCATSFVLMLILLELFAIFGRSKFILNFIKVNYNISRWWRFVRVAFYPSGLLSGVGISSGLLPGGLMSGGRLSVHRPAHPQSFRKSQNRLW